ncbi:MAG: uroporphyrinogen-III C-methyltransferase [Leptothrix sp. (in: Bacteria)]|jgi:uroporphyrin-3 C-methyltransferase|nr:uroporphyrinogen-III C-methyltransferase [Leptothrix sp. (in: b-proteobacteria)]
MSAQSLVPVMAAVASPHTPWLVLSLAAAAVLSGVAIWVAWDSREQVRTLELELVRRQQGSAEQATEARTSAKQAQELARDTAAKITLLEARLTEVSMQRSQLDELIQSMSRSRDENLVVDIEAAVRVAQQQAALSGSVEPLVSALRTADERLARVNQPKLDRLRRAIARDLDRVRSAGVPDLGNLLIKLDEAVRLVDELPLQVSLSRPARPVVAATAPAASAASSDWWSRSLRTVEDWATPLQRAWQEVQGLVRVTRIDRPEAMLVAPDQGFFLRENLKLRLLNARLSLLSRQAEAAQSDLRGAQLALQTYFDGSSRKTQLSQDLLRQVLTQSRQLNLPRPDDTLAAVMAVVAGR